MLVWIYSHLNYLSYASNAVTLPLAIWNLRTKYKEHKLSKIIKITIPITYGEKAFLDEIEKITGRTLNLNACLDFCIWDKFSMEIAEEKDFRNLLVDAKKLNNVRIPIYKKTEHGKLDCFSYLIISVRDDNILKFSHGGTGVVQLFLFGKFRVESRMYSGPSTEYTLREIT